MKKTRIEQLEVEGNKGGSFVHLATNEIEGMCCIRVGHECVVRVPYQDIAVTRLAQIIADALDPSRS